MKTALVTGATSGIGRAIALHLCRAGYAVTAIGRNAAALEALVMQASGIAPLCLDLTDRAATETALSGRTFDVLVNNAGLMPPPGPFAASGMSGADQALAVNLTAVLHLTGLLIVPMKAQGSGHILFIGSIAAHAPAPNFAVYGATKAAISSFAASLRAELSPYGIRVTEIAPGRVKTALYASVLDDATRDAMYGDGTALRPEDVAEAVLSVLALPPRADVARLDILPTRPVPPIKL